MYDEEAQLIREWRQGAEAYGRHADEAELGHNTALASAALTLQYCATQLENLRSLTISLQELRQEERHAA